MTTLGPAISPQDMAAFTQKKYIFRDQQQRAFVVAYSPATDTYHLQPLLAGSSDEKPNLRPHREFQGLYWSFAQQKIVCEVAGQTYPVCTLHANSFETCAILDGILHVYAAISRENRKQRFVR